MLEDQKIIEEQKLDEDQKMTVGKQVLGELVREAIANGEVLRTVRLKLKLNGVDRGYMGLNEKNSKENFICDLPEAEATVFEVKKTKYTTKAHYTYELKNKPYKGRWLDYHTGVSNGGVFAESHKWTEFDIAIWQYDDHKLQALIGHKYGELPICGETDSHFIYASARMTPFEVIEEKI